MSDSNKNTARSGAQAARKAHRRTGRHRRPAQGREPRPAPAPRHAGQRAHLAAAQERAGAHPRRGHDRPAEDHGTRRMSQPDAARVSVRILDKEYFVACPHEERAALLDARRVPQWPHARDPRQRQGRGPRPHRRHGGAQYRQRVPASCTTARPGSTAKSASRVKGCANASNRTRARASSSICEATGSQLRHARPGALV